MTPSEHAPQVTSAHPAVQPAEEVEKPGKELVIVTGISGAGKASALKAFEDLGFHAVDNLPLELLPDFAALVGKSAEMQHAAIVVDVREGQTLDRLPEILIAGEEAFAHPRGFSGCAGRGAGAALLRDPAAASAGPAGDGFALHCRRAATAGPHPQCRRHADRHLELQRARAARPYSGALWPRGARRSACWFPA